MISGLLIASASQLDKLLPYRGSNRYPAGIYTDDNSLSKYALPSTDQPNIIIKEPIYDGNGNSIAPGFYELTLTIERDKLILSQSGKTMAIIPVFKVEVEKPKEPIAQPMDNKSLKKSLKQEKKLEKKNKKLIRQGKIPEDKPQIYTNASIEYDEAGDYYVFKYERGSVKAWGAIKSSNW